MELYKGCPLTAKQTLEQMIENGWLQLIDPVEGDLYQLDEPGVYSCHIYEENQYHVLKIFNVEAADLSFHLSEKCKDVFMKMAGSGPDEGWQPTGRPALAPEKFSRDQRETMLCIWPDEILEIFGDANMPDHHQMLKQEALIEKLQEMEADCPYMELHSLGETRHLQQSIPMAVFSTSTGEAFHDKITVWYQAQVHGNEPASCDGALEVMRRMMEDESYRELLNHLNLIVIPRVNPDGAYLYRRSTFAKIDLNRDHLAVRARETRFIHKAFQKYRPEVVLDGHEFISYELEKIQEGMVTKRGWELMTSPATSLNIEPGVRQLSLELCEDAFSEIRKHGLTVNHFGTSEKACVGRTYFGLHHALSFLVETRGIGAGRCFYNQRVSGQVAAMSAYLFAAAKRAEEIKTVVHKARQAEYQSDVIVLHQEASNETLTSYYGTDCQYTIEGTEVRNEKDYMALTDRCLRCRTKPAGYILSSKLEKIKKILIVMKNVGVSYTQLPAGTALKVQGYHCLGIRPGAEAAADILAELTAPDVRVFEEDVYFFSTDQPEGMVLAMLMEPDVTDSVGTRGTLYQQGLVACEDIFRVSEIYDDQI